MLIFKEASESLSRPAPTGDRPKACRRSAVWNFVVVHEALPAELVYALTQALLDHADEVRAAYPTAAAMTRANAVANTFLPFHLPGAARYYREKAVPVQAPGCRTKAHPRGRAAATQEQKRASSQSAAVAASKGWLRDEHRALW